MTTFSALVARENGGEIEISAERLEESFLPDGDVTIDVEFSSVNYKDALVSVPSGGVAKGYPLIPGIDIAGTVSESSNADFQVGDRVIAHGYEIGVSRHGGYAEKARVPASWVVKLDELSTFEAAAIGTAGYTAALSIEAVLAHGVTPSSGPILVTGATGGVGTISVDILSRLGFDVVASTGKESSRAMLKELGASETVGRLPGEEKVRPLGKATWAAVVDCVGGPTLAYALSTMKYGAIAAISGLAGSPALPTTVLPFILRNGTLAGIESGQVPIDDRRALWAKLGREYKPTHLDAVFHQISTAHINDIFADILSGAHIGRSVVNIAGGF